MCHLARLAAFFLAATFSLHAAGCESSSASRHTASASAAKPAVQASQQLIVKFKPKSVACTERAIARFSKSAGVSLTWLRPMSGQACVVTQEAGSVDELVNAQERLKRHPDIEWVEIDAAMQRH